MADEQALPNPEDFYLKTPLYKPYEIGDWDDNLVFDILFYLGTIDCLCPFCNRVSVFTGTDNLLRNRTGVPITRERWVMSSHSNQVYVKQLICSRNSIHSIYFVFLLESHQITKIGQNPSHADLSSNRLDAFRKVLSKDVFQEMKKAFGLIGHGIGIGSFVYLRRVLEMYIVKPAYELAKEEDHWDEDLYQKSRFGEKLKILKSRLPEYLIDNVPLYGVISKGIHELSEDECKQFFPVVSEVILLILTDIKAEQEREKSREALKNALSGIALKVSK